MGNLQIITLSPHSNVLRWWNMKLIFPETLLSTPASSASRSCLTEMPIKHFFSWESIELLWTNKNQTLTIDGRSHSFMKAKQMYRKSSSLFWSRFETLFWKKKRMFIKMPKQRWQVVTVWFYDKSRVENKWIESKTETRVGSIESLSSLILYGGNVLTNLWGAQFAKWCRSAISSCTRGESYEFVATHH